LNARENLHPRIEIIKFGVNGFFPQAERVLLEKYGLQYRPDLILVAFFNNDLKDKYSNFHPESFPLHQPPGWLEPLVNHSSLARLIFRHRIYKRQDAILAEHEDSLWQDVFREYDLMQALARKVGVQLVIVNIAAMNGSVERTQPVRFGEKLSTYCQDRGIPFINTNSALRKESQKAPTFWPIDGHCNPRGYQAIAGVIYQELLRQKLVPG